MRSTFLPAGVPIVLAVGALVAAGHARDDAAPSPGTEAVQTLSHGGRQRTYLLHDFSNGRPAPLVVVLHGGGGNARNAVAMTGFDRIGVRERLIVAYPNGTGPSERLQMFTWNAGHCCAYAMRSKVDDVGFIAALIEHLTTSGRVDVSRIFVTGMSNGGMLVHRLGRELSPRIAALAPVVGAVFGDEPPPAGPVPVYVVVGADDERVPGAGGLLRLPRLVERGAADHPVAPAIEQARYWARANACRSSQESRSAACVQIVWRECDAGADIVFVSVNGNGHAWPGGRPGRAGADTPTRAFDASAEIWRFFADHPRRSVRTR